MKIDTKNEKLLHNANEKAVEEVLPGQEVMFKRNILMLTSVITITIVLGALLSVSATLLLRKAMGEKLFLRPDITEIATEVKLKSHPHDSKRWKAPTPPADPTDKKAMQEYLRKLYVIQEMKLRELRCEPVKQVLKIENLLGEDSDLYDELHDIVVPDQAVVLDRCLGKASYCPGIEQQCLPAAGLPKKMRSIAIMVYNSTLGKNFPIMRNVEVHDLCTCQ